MRRVAFPFRYLYPATVLAAFALLLFGPIWTAIRFTEAFGEFHC